MHETSVAVPAIFNLVPILPFLPLAAFVLIVLWANRDKKLSAGLAIGGVGLSWVLGWAVAFTTFGIEGFGEPVRMFRDWLPTGRTWQAFGFAVDPLAAAMLIMVPFVCFLIFVYSVGYMGVGKPESDHDERGAPAEPGHVDRLASRFFAYIALFATGMIGLILADNLIMLLIFWEIMGLCSYLLIGFWFARKYDDPKQITPKEAGLKAFLTTRIGDTVMLAGIFLLYAQTQSLSFADIFKPETLERLATTTVNLPLIGATPWATLIGILIFCGAIGKSAQFPLHVWLPDAMEGPTPVSALIHAATMVSAGVYLAIRTFPLMQAVPHGPAMQFMAFIGAFTALFAATIAVAQNDIKRVLAYSTISQLGYMFAALGIGAYVAATFHLLTHAFFKALLFLGSGSVIHGMEHGHHAGMGQQVLGIRYSDTGDQYPIPNTHAFDPQDMRNMGGLFRRMPRTAWTFIIGGLALSGFPIVTAGFWSKDEILSDAFNGHTVVFITLALAALLTAFYTARQIVMTFFGAPRTAAAEHASEHDSIFAWMTVPLMALAVFAVAGGWVGIPREFPVLGALSTNPFHHYIEGLAEALEIHVEELPFNSVPLLTSLVVALGGLTLGWLVYRKFGVGAGLAPAHEGDREGSPLQIPDPLARPLGGLYTVLRNKYYFDEIYHAVFIRPVQRLATWLYRVDDLWVIDPLVDGVGKLWRGISEVGQWLDTHIVDGAVNGLAAVIGWCGGFVRVIQTGKAQNYLLVGLVTVSVLLGAFLLLPK
ncbi:MAG: NADH-quinone oxidoreductase subunit L [Chloroflexi bacterium HGW-Chloroflexi-1]|nr:MAG: NADH-quinone oxidoreductase subunit L [Chloroflexi bacterium HGW-Chloroflexi-1]